MQVQGAIGDENSYLLGTLIVSAIHQTALSRQRQKESQRQDFFLYIDEFQNFITASMAEVLTGARKYHLGLILAHHGLDQLFENDRKVASMVLNNPCTRISFHIGNENDARKISDGFSFFEAKDLTNLDIGGAIARIEKADRDFNLKTFLPDEVYWNVDERKERIVDYTRKTYTVKREDIETELAMLMRPTIKTKDSRKAAIKERPVINITLIKLMINLFLEEASNLCVFSKLQRFSYENVY